MTGIERLHKLIADIDVSADPELWYILRGGTEGDWDCEEHDDKTLGSTLAAIADQIERDTKEWNDALEDENERLRDMLNQVAWHLGLEESVHYYSDDNYQSCQKAVLAAIDSRMRVLSVVTEMERHCLGHEGMDDSPVARWARELLEALGGNGRDPAAYVSVSAYDLLPADEREAIAWVREYGGIGCVQTMAAKLKVRPGERVKRPAPKVLDADGAEIRVGDTVYDNELGTKATVTFVHEGMIDPDFPNHVIRCKLDGDKDYESHMFKPDQLTHRAPVLAADGEPLEVGQTVWDTDAESNTPLTVVEVSSDLVRCEYKWKDGKTYRPCYPPDQLTHTKPEPLDSAERIAEDIRRMAEEWCSYPSLREASEKAASSVGEATMGVALGNLSKRCRALAERERGE